MDTVKCPECGEELPKDSSQCTRCHTWFDPSINADPGALDDGWLESPADALSEFHERPSSGAAVAGDNPNPQHAHATIPEPSGSEDTALSDSQLRRVAFLRSRLDQIGPDPSTILNLGRVYEEAQSPEGALHYYEACLEVAPEQPYALERVGALRLQIEMAPKPGPAAGRTTGVATQAKSDILPDPTSSAPVRDRSGGVLDEPTGTSAPVPTAPSTVSRTARASRTATGRPDRRGASPRIPRHRRASRPLVAAILGLAAIFAVGGIGLIALHQAPIEHVVSQPGHGVAEAAFSPDGQLLAFLELPPQIKKDSVLWGIRDGGQGTLRIHDLARRAPVAEYTDARIPPDGGTIAWGGPQRIAYGSSGGRIAIVDLSGVAPTVHVKGSNPSFSPDGTKLAFDRLVEPTEAIEAPLAETGDDGNGDGETDEAQAPPAPVREVLVHDLATGAEQQLSDGGGRRPSFAPSGDRVAYEKDGTIIVAFLDGRPATILTPHGHDHSPDWTSDGRMITWLRRDPDPRRRRSVIADRLWAAAADGIGAHEVLSFEEQDAIALSTARFSADGKLLFFLGLAGGRSGIVIHPERGLVPGGFEDELGLFLRDVPAGLTYPLGTFGTEGLHGNPILAPDRSYLAYTVLVDGAPELHVAPWSEADPR